MFNLDKKLETLKVENIIADCKTLHNAKVEITESLAKNQHGLVSMTNRQSGYYSIRFGFDYQNTDNLYYAKYEESFELLSYTYTGPLIGQA